MGKLMRGIRHGGRGFTLIELLIVVAILGVIAAVVIPNVTAFMGSAALNAANSEVQNLRTAALGYYADHASDTSPWPATEADLDDYLTGDVHGTYTFDAEGVLTGTSYDNLVWDVDKWIKP